MTHYNIKKDARGICVNLHLAMEDAGDLCITRVFLNHSNRFEHQHPLKLSAKSHTGSALTLYQLYFSLNGNSHRRELPSMEK